MEGGGWPGGLAGQVAATVRRGRRDTVSISSLSMLSRDISPHGDGPQDAEVTFKCLPSRIAFQLLPCRGNSRARGE